ncbi:MAG TPA: hypothetical protein VK934_01165, partial [Fimbriimonas sp.]|nr:hypothetical protein [Fimbriimonas sp.]
MYRVGKGESFVFRFASYALRGLLATSTCVAASASFAATTDGFVKAALSRTPEGRLRLVVKTDNASQLEPGLARIGGYTYRHLPLIHSLAVDIPARKLRALVADPLVEHVSA